MYICHTWNKFSEGNLARHSQSSHGSEAAQRDLKRPSDRERDPDPWALDVSPYKKEVPVPSLERSGADARLAVRIVRSGKLLFYLLGSLPRCMPDVLYPSSTVLHRRPAFALGYSCRGQPHVKLTLSSHFPARHTYQPFTAVVFVLVFVF